MKVKHLVCKNHTSSYDALRYCFFLHDCCSEFLLIIPVSVSDAFFPPHPVRLIFVCDSFFILFDQQKHLECIVFDLYRNLF